MSGKAKNTSVVEAEIQACLKRALEEHIGAGDVTTDSIVPRNTSIRGQIIAKQAGTVAGLDIARQVFLLLDNEVDFRIKVEEGARVEDRTILAEITGAARALLSGERTALNFVGRMSGIATLTRQFVDAVEGTSARILDTRKTAPGLRLIDKLAVQRGGGENHRMGLFDMVLIKDNHIDFAGSSAEAFARARAAAGGLEIEIEARTLEEVIQALDLGAERILLDNMTLEQMRAAVRLTSGRARLEASGNINASNVRAIAETGVDFISVGALTHSAPVFDVSLKWIG